MFETNIIPPTPVQNSLKSPPHAVGPEPEGERSSPEFPSTPSVRGPHTAEPGSDSEAEYGSAVISYITTRNDSAAQEEIAEQIRSDSSASGGDDSLFNAATFLAGHAAPVERNPSAAASATAGSLHSSPERPRSVISHSSRRSRRKPVPKFLPSPASTEGGAASPIRLSIGGFEALIARGDSADASPAGSKRSSTDDLAAPPPPKRTARPATPELSPADSTSAVFSPRFGLGLDERGVRARQERRLKDERRRAASREWGSFSPKEVHDAGAGGGKENARPRATKQVSWSDRMRQAEWDHTQAANKEMSPALPAKGPMDAYRRPNLNPPVPLSARTGTSASFQPLPLHNTPFPDRRSPENGVRWWSRRPSQPMEDKDELEQVVVVPSHGWNSVESTPEIGNGALGTTFRPERMHFEMVDYGLFGRILHLVYPAFIFAHYPATLFLDYNLIYILAQIAMSPSLPTTAALVARDVAVPTLHASTGWWVALAAYATCTLLWILAVCLYRDVGKGYIQLWGKGHVDIGRVYAGAHSFNVGCLQSFSYFSFLWRVRFAALSKDSDLSVGGGTSLDFLLETFSWYRQNYPTVLLLLPRAGLSLAVLLLYGTTAYGSASMASMTRDSAYFGANGVLTGFASGVIMTNLAWAAWRVFLVAAAAAGLFILDGPCGSARRDSFSAYNHPSREHLTSNMSPDAGSSPASPYSPQHPRASATGLGEWRIRRARRLRTGILLCLRSSTSAPSTPATSAPSPYVGRLRKPDSPRNMLRRQESSQTRYNAEAKRHAALAVDGIEGADEKEHAHGRRYSPEGGQVLARNWAGMGAYVKPSPSLTPSSQGFMSPDSRPSTAATSQYNTPAMAGQGIHGSQMHKRVRSLPIDRAGDDFEIVGYSRYPTIERALRGDKALPPTPEASTPSGSSPSMFRGDPHKRAASAASALEHSASSAGRRTPIVIGPHGSSRRSSVQLARRRSSTPTSDATGTPATPFVDETTDWQFASAQAAQEAQREVLQYQGPGNNRLLSEVKRLGMAEAASREHDRRVAISKGLRPISETSIEGLTSPVMIQIPDTPLQAGQYSPGMSMTDDELRLAAASRRRRASEQSLTGADPVDWSPNTGAEGLLLPPFRLSTQSAADGLHDLAFQFGSVAQPTELGPGDIGLHSLDGLPRERETTAESALSEIYFPASSRPSLDSQEGAFLGDGLHPREREWSQSHSGGGRTEGSTTPTGGLDVEEAVSRPLSMLREAAQQAMMQRSPVGTFGRKREASGVHESDLE